MNEKAERKANHSILSVIITMGVKRQRRILTQAIETEGVNKHSQVKLPTPVLGSLCASIHCLPEGGISLSEASELVEGGRGVLVGGIKIAWVLGGGGAVKNSTTLGLSRVAGLFPPLGSCWGYMQLFVRSG